MGQFKKIGIVYKQGVEHLLEICEKIEKYFCAKQIVTIVTEINTPEKDIDLAIIVGGDGTILKAARFYAPLDIPIFGINVGRLGFLAQANINNIESSLEKIINNEYKIDERLMLSMKNNTISALNDIVVKGHKESSPIELKIYVNDNLVCKYLADGMIVATPTGSTAYTMSAGGPVLTPELEAIVLVPICPHTLTARPIVIPADKKIEIIPANKNEVFSAYADGQVKIEYQESITIEKSDKKAKILLLNKDDDGFYTILRDKLNWGVDPRA